MDMNSDNTVKLDADEVILCTGSTCSVPFPHWHNKKYMEIEAEGARALRELLRDYNHADVISCLGESDLLEAIGVTRQLSYCEAVALGPPTPDRQFVRARIAAIFTRMEREQGNVGQRR